MCVTAYQTNTLEHHCFDGQTWVPVPPKEIHRFLRMGLHSAFIPTEVFRTNAASEKTNLQCKANILSGLRGWSEEHVGQWPITGKVSIRCRCWIVSAQSHKH